jgi:hypothetical protein
MALDMNDPKDKEAVQKLIDDAVDKSTSALEAKRTELLAEVRKLKKKSDVDPDDHQAALDKIAELEGHIAENGKALKKLETETGTHKKAYETEAAYVQRLLVDNGLSETLVKAGVKVEFLPAVKAMLASRVQIVADGDSRTAKVGDKALAEYVGEWAKSDEGKHFVAAQGNAGSGALGGGGSLDGANLSDIKSPEARLAAINAQAQGTTT